MLPPAPARLSTMTDWPKACPSAGASVRASTSRLPPGEKGTTSVTGFCGKGCASAGAEASPQAIVSAIRTVKRLLLFIVSPCRPYALPPSAIKNQLRKPGPIRSSLRSNAAHSIKP